MILHTGEFKSLKPYINPRIPLILSQTLSYQPPPDHCFSWQFWCPHSRGFPRAWHFHWAPLRAILISKTFWYSDRHWFHCALSSREGQGSIIGSCMNQISNILIPSFQGFTDRRDALNRIFECNFQNPTKSLMRWRNVFQQFFGIRLGHKRGFLALVKAGNISQSFMNSGNQKSICPYCKSGKPSLHWDDASPQVPGLQTMRHTPLWTDVGNFEKYAQNGTANFYKNDPCHIFKYGIGWHFCANCAVVLCPWGYFPQPADNVDVLLRVRASF